MESIGFVVNPVRLVKPAKPWTVLNNPVELLSVQTGHVASLSADLDTHLPLKAYRSVTEMVQEALGPC